MGFLEVALTDEAEVDDTIHVQSIFCKSSVRFWTIFTNQPLPWKNKFEILNYRLSLGDPCIKTDGLVFHGMA